MSLLWALVGGSGYLSAQEFALMEKGWKHYENSRFDSAVYYFNESLKQYPEEHFALKLRGMAYASMEDYPHAIADLSEALKYHVDSIETLNVRLKCYYLTGKLDFAVADATIILDSARSHYNRGNALYYRALALYDLKKFELANHDTDELLKGDSSNGELLLLKAQIELRKNNPQGALTATQKALNQYPNNAAAHVVRGFAWARLGNREEIAKEAKLAMRMTIKDAETLARVALLYTLTFEDEVAEAIAKQAIDLNPNLGLAYASLGVAECALHKYPAAIKTLSKAISIDPTLVVCYLRRGQSHYMLKNYPAAHKDLFKAQQLDPSQPESYMFIGYVYQAMKNQSQACRYWKIAYEKGGTDIGEEIKIFCK